jgi:hypothetical protein
LSGYVTQCAEVITVRREPTVPEQLDHALTGEGQYTSTFTEPLAGVTTPPVISDD